MSRTINSIAANLAAVSDQIGAACAKYHRSADEVTLVAVSKTKPVADMLAAYKAGQRSFGENYLQEALPKIAQLIELDISWHYIGPIQSNKTRTIAEHFDWVQSVDRFKIAQRLNQQRPAELAPLNICLQVNIDDAATKAGVAPIQAAELAAAIAQLPNLRLRGLMAIPDPLHELSRQRASFARLHLLAERLRTAGIVLDTLSMGMTDDLEAAIAEGSTMVRIGTAIFGKRRTKMPT